MKIDELIKKLAEKGDEVYSIAAKVKEINESERTCDVEPLDGAADIFGVRLQSVPDDDKGICVFPKVGSTVVVTFLNKKTGYVALCAEVDKIVGKFGSFEYVQDSNGFEGQLNAQKIKFSGDSFKVDGFFEAVSGANGLKSALDELLDTLMSAVITTPSGPGAFDPGFITAVTALKAKIATFLK